MKDRLLKVLEMALDKFSILMVTSTKAHLRMASEMALVYVSLDKQEQFIKESGEKTDLLATVYCFLCQMR
jgi:hypothetical protein